MSNEQLQISPVIECDSMELVVPVDVRNYFNRITSVHSVVIDALTLPITCQGHIPVDVRRYIDMLSLRVVTRVEKENPTEEIDIDMLLPELFTQLANDLNSQF